MCQVVFPGGLPFRPTYWLACLDMSEIILKGTLNWIKTKQKDPDTVVIWQIVFSLPVRKYKKSYCSHPGVDVSVGGVSASALLLCLSFLVKFFRTLDFLNFYMDLVILYLLLDIGLKFYAKPSWPTSKTFGQGHRLWNLVLCFRLKFLAKVFSPPVWSIEELLHSPQRRCPRWFSG